MNYSFIPVFLFLAVPVFAQQLKPFTTDGCSSFPDGTVKQQSLWIDCCIRHDLAYWKGGSYDERLAADEALRACVARVGEPEIANLMLAGVRFGGSPYMPTPYRWGYGWSFFRGYTKLTPEELLKVKKKFGEFKEIIETIEKELD